jgi:predicted XRE-type DNA-binding protein
MQLMSMITGQYYMNGITKQLKNIDKKINLLIKFHHTEKIARLENSQVLIQQLCDVQYPGIEHLTQLKNIEFEVGAIYREYSSYLNDSINAISKVDDTYDIFSQKHFDKLFLLDGESGFSFNFYMVTTSDEILHLIPIIEFMLNVKINARDNSRNYQIDELYNKIAKYTKDSFFANSTGRVLLEKYYTPFIDQANNILNTTIFHQEDSERRKKIIENRKENIKNDILDSAETLNIKTKLIEQMTQPVEILY